MRVLIVEDDFTSRKLLQSILSAHGECDVAVDGEEAVKAFRLAFEEGKPYHLVCMDIMMPGMDGQQALKEIRSIETEKNIKASDEAKVIMTTALGDPKNVMEAYNKGGATAYVVKPLHKKKFLDEVRNLGLIA